MHGHGIRYPATEEIALPKHESGPTDMPPIAFTYECDGQTQMNCFGKKHPIPYPAWTPIR